jgi:hypothetical protein
MAQKEIKILLRFMPQAVAILSAAATQRLV